MAIHYFFHGTSYNNYLSIIKNGFIHEDTIWDCSDDESIYMYDLEEYVESEGLEDEDFENQHIRCMETANESAQITQAFESNPSNKTVVLEFIVDDEKCNIFDFYPDDSCENMADAGAVGIDTEILNDYILDGKIKVKAHFFTFYPKLSLFYLSNLWNNPYIRKKKNEMDPIDLEAWEMISKSKCYLLDSLLYMEEIDEKEVVFEFSE